VSFDSTTEQRICALVEAAPQAPPVCCHLDDHTTTSLFFATPNTYTPRLKNPWSDMERRTRSVYEKLVAAAKGYFEIV